MLVFPAKPAYAHLSGRFYNGDLEDLAADFSMRRFALLLGEIQEGLIGKRLDETIAQQIQRKAKGPDRSVFGLALEYRFKERLRWDKSQNYL